MSEISGVQGGMGIEETSVLIFSTGSGGGGGGDFVSTVFSKGGGGRGVGGGLLMVGGMGLHAANSAITKGSLVCCGCLCCN